MQKNAGDVMQIAAVPALAVFALIAARQPAQAQAPAVSNTPAPAANGNLDLHAAPQAPAYKLLRYDEKLFGQNGAIDYNNEFTYQWGRFNGGSINAYALQTDNGITAKRWCLSPRLGLRVDLATGDQNPKDHSLQTFNPLFVAPNYYNQSSIAGPRNFLDVHSTLDLHPARTVDILADWDFFWRESLKDGVYGPTGTGVVAAANGSEAKFAGSIPNLKVTWSVDKHVSLLANYARFYPGGFLADNHLTQNTNYFTTWVDYKS
jgi:hypothetical protein